MKVNTKTIKDLALNYAIAKTTGYLDLNTPSRLKEDQALMWFIVNNPNYTKNFQLTGDIQTQEGIGVNKYSELTKKDKDNAWFSSVNKNFTEYLAEGSTPQEAILRCYLLYKVGEEIEIPEALLEV